MNKIKPDDSQAIIIILSITAFLLFVTIIILMGYIITAYYNIEPEAKTWYNKGSEISLIQENSLVGIVNPVYIKPIVYGALIDCLIQKESSGNPEAVGKAGECGILQFMPSTFQHFCVEKYGLRDDIWDEIVQKECCDLMLEDNLAFHWSTLPKCQ